MLHMYYQNFLKAVLSKKEQVKIKRQTDGWSQLIIYSYFRVFANVFDISNIYI